VQALEILGQLRELPPCVPLLRWSYVRGVGVWIFVIVFVGGLIALTVAMLVAAVIIGLPNRTQLRTDLSFDPLPIYLDDDDSGRHFATQALHTKANILSEEHSRLGERLPKWRLR
jgi:hypothetical protein